MASRHRHSHTYPRRVTAYALVAFLVLSSSRALIPGLCATQAELHAGDDPECTTHACCAPTSKSESPGVALDNAVPHVDCAFCKLATARIVTTPSPFVVSAMDDAGESIAVPRARPLAPHDWTPADSRGPPALLI